jgi:hypothetical protein
MRYWALRLGREAPPCILSRGRKRASGEPAGGVKWTGRYFPGAAPNKATATPRQRELKNGNALGSGRQ